MSAGEARDDDIENGDDAGDDGFQDGTNTVDNGHQAAADGAKDGFNARDDSTHCGYLICFNVVVFQQGLDWQRMKNSRMRQYERFDQ
jgi:hypothetical protein